MTATEGCLDIWLLLAGFVVLHDVSRPDDGALGDTGGEGCDLGVHAGPLLNGGDGALDLSDHAPHLLEHLFRLHSHHGVHLVGSTVGGLVFHVRSTTTMDDVGADVIQNLQGFI